MHSSRMRTVRSSSHLPGEGGLPQCMLGYVCPRGVSAQCMLGYVCPGGVSAPVHAGIHTAPCEQND